MTAPVPTLTAIAGLVEALERISRDWHPGHRTSSCDPFTVADAGLAAFRTRLPMAEDAELRREVYERATALHGAARYTGPALPNDYARAALVAIDARLEKP